jgi:hypothetical protein
VASGAAAVFGGCSPRYDVRPFAFFLKAGTRQGPAVLVFHEAEFVTNFREMPDIGLRFPSLYLKESDPREGGVP